MKYLITNEYWKINKDYNLEKLLYLLIDRPALINGYNSFIWKNVIREDHRNYDLPAYVRNDNYTEWCINNRRIKWKYKTK